MAGVSLGTLEIRGRIKAIMFLRLQSGNEPARTFLEKRTKQQKVMFRIRFQEVADNGSANVRKFKYVEGSQKIFEFKDNSEHRVLCFLHPPDVIVLTNGARKRKGKLPPEAVRLAETYHQQLLDAQEDERRNRMH